VYRADPYGESIRVGRENFEGGPVSVRARVLVVDDDVALRKSIRRMLARSFDVTESADGAEAIARVESGESFDLVLMDLEMPRMNGRRALDRLREISPELAERTVIMSGGSGDAELRAWLETLGAGRFLLKPFSKTTLHETLLARLGK
jgi:CheY-like chemotaxis protein